MNEKSILFAKLAGLNNRFKSFLAKQGNRDRNIRIFKAEVVEEMFSNYSEILKSLKVLLPELYSDMHERKMPEPSETGFIERPFLESILRDIDYIFTVNAEVSVMESKAKKNHRKIFISHGSSQDWMKVQIYIEKDLDIDTLELAQQPNKGRTVLQKLNEESDTCSYAVVVMTGDDKISKEETRARENVMHEIGFLQAKYGLEKVCLLHEEGTNIPSNIGGLVYIPFPKGTIDASFSTLSRELKVYFK